MMILRNNAIYLTAVAQRVFVSNFIKESFEKYLKPRKVIVVRIRGIPSLMTLIIYSL